MPWNNFFNRRSSQAAAPPVDTPAPDPRDVSPWMAQNTETLDELARFIDFAEGFTLGFLEINFTSDFDAVLKALQARPDCAQMEFHTFILDDPNLRFLKDALEDRIQQLPSPISTLLERKKVILVRGLENAIGLFGDYPPLLQDLNFVRDTWINSVPYPVLLCLPSYAINRLIQFAPDFWSWKSGVFRILSTQTSTDNAYIRGLHANKILGSLNRLERQERITLLEQLAQEFDPQTADCPKDDLRIAAKALTELGQVHLFAGEFPKAKEALSRVAPIFSLPTWSPETTADVRIRINYLNRQGYVAYRIGNSDAAAQSLNEAIRLNRGIDEYLLAITLQYQAVLIGYQGRVAEAIDLCQQALAIYERIGNDSDRANLLEGLAIFKSKQGEVVEAIALCQRSLILCERVENDQGKVGSLQQLAILKDQQGELVEAIDLLQQSLEICERIENAQATVVSLRALGNLRAKQREIAEAIALYQQALVTCRRVGSVWSEAQTLWKYGELLADHRGDKSAAVPLLQEALAIFQQVSSPDAAKVQAKLDELLAADGNKPGTTEEP
ncbi:MAG: tetratricopeptide repeat protein [Spirulina sp.]